jgi:signal transduction histidine kinase
MQVEVTSCYRRIAVREDCNVLQVRAAHGAIQTDLDGDIGAGRAFGIVSTFVVLLALLSETLALYANLARSIIRQRNERHARQIAMDAMAASIVHEIKQPLSAIETSAGAGLRWLNRPTPELDKLGDGLTRIVRNVRRLNEIVGSTRSMFKKGAHGQTLLNVNDLIRETLTMIDLDLRTHRVSVTTDLSDRVPSSRVIEASCSKYF